MSVQHIDEKKEIDQILKSGKITVIDFFANWCGPCKILGPIFEKLATEITDVNFIKVDVDKASELAQQYQISSIPTLIYFDKNGNSRDTTHGLVPAPKIKSIIDKLKGE